MYPFQGRNLSLAILRFPGFTMSQFLKRFNSTSIRPLAVTGLLCAMMFGCGRDPEFEPNKLRIKVIETEIGQDLTATELGDVQQAVEEMFGSAEVPKLIEGVEAVSLDRLRQAAGRVYSDEQDVHFGLYRKHCIRCHGTAGDGRGPAARLLSPYPRDFRLGKFKFKSTPQGSKPTADDLARTLRMGIPGTSMPSFSLLRDSEIEALAEYVIYLSARGETERELLNQVSHTLDYSRGDRLIDFDLKTKKPADFDAQFDKLESVAKSNYAKWQVASPPSPTLPTAFPVGVVADVEDSASIDQLQKSVARGRQLFIGNLASCSKCHGEDGSGSTAPKDYDLWTKDWTVAANINPEDKAAIKPMLKAGALKPVLMRPRDLREGVYRGGGTPQDIYLRIVNGIEGTSMPAAALQPNVSDGLTTDQVWDLVNFVLNLPSVASEVKLVKANAESDQGARNEPQ